VKSPIVPLRFKPRVAGQITKEKAAKRQKAAKSAATITSSGLDAMGAKRGLPV